MTSFFSAEGGPIWIKFRRLVQNDMSTAVIWSTSKPDVEFQCGGRLAEFKLGYDFLFAFHSNYGRFFSHSGDIQCKRMA